MKEIDLEREEMNQGIETTKKCSKCLEIKSISEFVKDINRKDGLYVYCKYCQKKYIDINKANIALKNKLWRESNKKYVALENKAWKLNNPEKVKLNNKRYYKNNKKSILNRHKIKYNKNKEYHKQFMHNWYLENKEQVLKKTAIRTKLERYRNPIFKLSGTIRNLIGDAFRRKSFTKSSRTHKILGCSFEFLHNYLTGTFCLNYGRMPTEKDNIHIDHIIPLALAKTKEQVILLNHYTNLQWLLAEDNLEKSRKLDWKRRS